MNIWEGGKRRGETEKNHKRLLTENKLRVDGGMWVGDRLDG